LTLARDERLASDQAVSWEMEASATRLGYRQVHAVSFHRLLKALQGTNVELKRHHNSRSFRGRVTFSTTYSFALGNCGGSTSDSCDGGAETNTIAVPWQALNLEEVEEPVVPQQNDKETKPYCCKDCERRFTTEKALVNHQEDVHRQMGGPGGGGGGSRYHCQQCQRDFSNSDALDQVSLFDKSGLMSGIPLFGLYLWRCSLMFPSDCSCSTRVPSMVVTIALNLTGIRVE